MLRLVKLRWLFGCGFVPGLLLVSGCADGISADEQVYLNNEDAVQEFRKEIEITEQVRAEELQQDDQIRISAKARDVGPLNELVRHRERAKSRDGSTPAVDIGPTAELERHRQNGGCLKCPR